MIYDENQVILSRPVGDVEDCAGSWLVQHFIVQRQDVCLSFIVISSTVMKHDE